MAGAMRWLEQLDDVFAEIGLHRLDAVGFEVFVDGDFLADHGFAFGYRAGAGVAADVKHGLTRLGGVAAPVHVAPGVFDLVRETLQIAVQVL